MSDLFADSGVHVCQPVPTGQFGVLRCPTCHPDVPYRTFDGDTIDEDPGANVRLSGQLSRVWELMRDGEWRSIAEIAEKVNATEQGVSARLRDLRKEKYGAHDVERRLDGPGLFRYRIVPKETT